MEHKRGRAPSGAARFRRLGEELYGGGDRDYNHTIVRLASNTAAGEIWGDGIGVGELGPLVATACAILWLLAVAWLSVTCAAALLQPVRRRRLVAGRRGDERSQPPVTVVVPVSSPAPALSQCAASLAALAHPEFEVVLCCARDDRAAIDAIAAEVARHPSLQLAIVTPTELQNPKSALLEAAVPLARHELLLLSDDNVVSSPDRIADHLACRDAGFGLVSACALGEGAGSFWAEVDAAFMNGHFARLQCAGDALGLSFSTGKSMMVSRRALLDSGGFASAGETMCEDAVVQRQLVEAGLRPALSPRPVFQPLGRRSLSEVWHRHLRWATCRRRFAPLLFVIEVFVGTPVAMFAGAVAAPEFGIAPAVGAGATAALFLGIEWAFLRLAGWPAGPHFAAAWAARELLAPALSVTAVLPRRRIIWRQRPVALRR